MAAAAKILSAALRLKAEERYGLTEHLLGAPAEGSSQEGVDSAWAFELDRRLQAIRRGAPQGDAVVETRLRARLSKRRGT